jgi:chemotaxis protein CheX
VGASGHDTGTPESAGERLLEPFIEATRVALREMAGTEVVVREVYRDAPPRTPVDVAALVRFTPAAEGPLVLGFPMRTAAGLAGRILAGAAGPPDEDLVRDCVGEIANVVAGQAKAILGDTPRRFTFSVPEVVAGPFEFRPEHGTCCLVAAFDSEEGGFCVQLFRKP